MYERRNDISGYELFPQAGLTALPISYFDDAISPITGWQGMVKRAMDIVIAMVALAIFAVPMLLIALAIRLDSPGDALFRQWRVGFGNVCFETLKFRTMHDHPPEMGWLRQAKQRDPRVTRLGAFLRRTSLDELPQLFNVLRGEMSIVGPRPHAPNTRAGGKPFELVTWRYPARHCVRPGMTGLAQVRGWRGETETEEKLLRRVEADLEYIEHWSLWLDVVILVRTALMIFNRQNAY
jgi:lipopolysaccharide/colanic/teichoic acid biosynthesis glycosyltransferase